MGDLSVRLSQLRPMAEGADKDERESQARIGKHILKYATEHQAELAQDKWSLQMLTYLARFLTDPADIQNALLLRDRLATSTTNQLPPLNP